MFVYALITANLFIDEVNHSLIKIQEPLINQ